MLSTRFRRMTVVGGTRARWMQIGNEARTRHSLFSFMSAEKRMGGEKWTCSPREGAICYCVSSTFIDRKLIMFELVNVKRRFTMGPATDVWLFSPWPSLVQCSHLVVTVTLLLVQNMFKRKEGIVFNVGAEPEIAHGTFSFHAVNCMPSSGRCDNSNR